MLYFSDHIFPMNLFLIERYKVNALMNVIVCDNLQVALQQQLNGIVFTNNDSHATFIRW